MGTAITQETTTTTTTTSPSDILSSSKTTTTTKMPTRLISLWRQEIGRDKVLRWYGAALGLMECLTCYYWHTRWHEYWPLLTADAYVVCWPFFQYCDGVRSMDVGGGILQWELDYFKVTIWMYSIGVLGLVTTILYLSADRWSTRRFCAWAWWMHLITVVVKSALLLLDFRMRLNQHMMALWATCTFLFVAHKRDVMRVLICNFYFWAGIVKLNYEWISGAALASPLVPAWFFQGPIIPISCVFAIIVEVFLVWGYLCQNKKWLMLCLGQLFAFHLESFWIVGFFFPILMFLILSIAPMIAIVGEEQEPPQPTSLSGKDNAVSSSSSSSSLYARFFSGKAPLSVYIVMAMFAACNVFHHSFPGSTAVSGEGRFASLHMYDAIVQCRVQYIVRNPPPEYEDDEEQNQNEPQEEKIRYIAPAVPGLLLRSQCDPWIYVEWARNICENEILVENEEEDDDLILDLIIEARLSSDAAHAGRVESNHKNTTQSSGDSSLQRHRHHQYPIDESYATMVNETNVCERYRFAPYFWQRIDPLEKAETFSYKWWTHNEWIRPYYAKSTVFSSTFVQSLFFPKHQQQEQQHSAAAAATDKAEGVHGSSNHQTQNSPSLKEL